MPTGLAGCASRTGPERVPLVRAQDAAPPPPELSEAMWILRTRVQELDVLLRPRGALTPRPDPARVAALLDEMSAVIRPLRDDLDDLNDLDRPLLEHNLPALEDRIDQARAALDADPPSFRAAERVSAVCVECHEQQP